MIITEHLTGDHRVRHTGTVDVTATAPETGSRVESSLVLLSEITTTKTGPINNPEAPINRAQIHAHGGASSASPTIEPERSSSSTHRATSAMYRKTR